MITNMAIELQPDFDRYYVLRIASYEATLRTEQAQADHKMRRRLARRYGLLVSSLMAKIDPEICLIGPSGRKLAFAIERLGDGAFYNPETQGWDSSRGCNCYTPLEEKVTGSYKVRLPQLDRQQDYHFHVADVETQQNLSVILLRSDADLI